MGCALLAVASSLILGWRVAAVDYSKPLIGPPFLLGPNLILNSNITQPVIKPNYYYVFEKPMQGMLVWKTKVKYVEYIDPVLQSFYQPSTCQYNALEAGWQFLDTDSVQCNEQYYQHVTLPGGRQLRLEFDAIPELPHYPLSQGLEVLWNGDVVFSGFIFTQCVLFTFGFYLISIEGVNEIAFRGLGIVDSNGVMISDIELVELIYLPPPPPPPVTFLNLSSALKGDQYSNVFTVFSYLKDIKFIGSFWQMSAVKQTFRFLFGIALEFNHLLLYNYHSSNLTTVANVILAGLQFLDDQRANLTDAYIYPAIGVAPQAIASTSPAANYTPAVNIKRIATGYIQRPNGLRLQLADSLLLDLPVTVLLFGLGFIIFRVLSRFRISLLFRSCSLLGCFFVTLLGGRIQILTFHFVSEVSLLVSKNPIQKIEAMAVVYCYFCMFLLAVSSVLVCRATYGKALQYILENCRYPSASYGHVTIGFGLFDVLLGLAHRLLVKFPLYQLCVLVLLETACLCFLLVFLFRRRYASALAGAISCGMSCVRLAFVVTLLAVDVSPATYALMSLVQEYLFYAMLGLWGASIVVGITRKCWLALWIVRQACRASKESAYREKDVWKQPAFVPKQDRKRMALSSQPADIPSQKQLIKKKVNPSSSNRSRLFSSRALQKKSLSIRR